MEEQRTTVATRGCISCGKVLQAQKFPGDDPSLDGELYASMRAPVYDGICLTFTTRGNYGSRMLDMSPYGVEGYLCDECFVQKSDRLYVYLGHDEGERLGKRLSEHDGALGKFDKHGAVYLARYSNGERWIDGVRAYAEVTSEQRSEVESIMLRGGGSETVSVPRGLLEGLMGALRAAEYNLMSLRSAHRDVRHENGLLKEELAGAPRHAEILALLHKEAEALSVTNLKDLKECARWGGKVGDWIDSHPLFHEDGTPLDTYRLWIELTKGAEGLREYEEEQAWLESHFKDGGCVCPPVSSLDGQETS